MQNSKPTAKNQKEQGVPLSVRFLETVSSPITATLVVTVILTTAYLLGEVKTGHLLEVLSGNKNSLGLRATATLIVLVTYIPLAHLFLRRWTGQHLTVLRATFGTAITFEHSASAGIAAGILGSAVFLVLFVVIPIFVVGFPAMEYQFITATVSGIVFGWLAGRFLVCMVKDSLRMSKLARDLPDLDLIELGPLSPFVQQGLKSALLTVIVLTITSHLSIAPGDALIGSVIFLLIWGTFMMLVFTLPVRGIRDRICREKQSQLEKLRAEIRDSMQQVLKTSNGDANDRLSALLNLETRIERVREWPYDAASWHKLGLYMLIGLGSWIGAATIERLLESVL